MGYLGNNSTLTGTQNNVRISATATADQTDFTVGGGYGIGAIDVYRNGVKLNAGNDFTASNGSTVTLVGAATAGDTIEFVVFESFEVSGAVSKNGDSTIQGALTATSFSGDGSSVTGVSADGLSATASVNTTGIITASNGFSGNISGVAGTFTGNVSGVNGTFTGNVTIGGTLTYEDVTNIDSVGLITARNGLQVLAGITTISGQTNLTNTNVTAGIATVAGQANLANVNVSAAGTVATLSATTATVSGQTTLANVNVATGIATVAGQTTLANVNVATGIATVAGQTALANLSVSGVSTITAGANLDGFKVEEGVYDTTALNGEFDFELEDGHIQTHTGSTAGTYFPDFKVSSGTTLSSVMDVGDVVSCTLIVAASNTAHYCTTGIKIDNSTSNLTIEWIGSAAPTAGKGAGYDIYAFTIQKTAATPAYLVIVNATDAG